jgi:hypothetical protein
VFALYGLGVFFFGNGADRDVAVGVALAGFAIAIFAHYRVRNTPCLWYRREP